MQPSMTASHVSFPARIALAALVIGCRGANGNSNPRANDPADAASPAPASTAGSARLPLTLVADVDLPGKAVRFDYQDIDPAHGHLVIAHMNDAAVDVVDLKDGALVKRLTDIPTARGVVVGKDRIFITSSPSQLVIVDASKLTEIARVPTGAGPDGVAWDGTHAIVGVSDQRDGAVSLIANAGDGSRTPVKVGVETGNVVFDGTRGLFWVTVVRATPPDQLVAIDPVAATATTSIPLPGCDGAHGLRLHPDGKSALVACEGNNLLARVGLEGDHAVVTAKTGAGPDVLSIDPTYGWLYVAAESGDLTVFDLARPGLEPIDNEHVGDHAHSVAVDPSTHRVFFPLLAGPKGTPILRIMQPQPPR